MSIPSCRQLIPAALAALVLFAAAPAAPAQTVIKMATLVPQGSTWHQALQEMAADWQKLSGGKVTLRLYPGGVAGDDSDVVRKMRLGTLNAALLTSTGIQDVDRSVLALQIPLAFADFGEFDCALETVGPMIEKTLESRGFVMMGWTDGGYAHFFTKSPVRGPDDLKKQKLFVWAGDDMLVELWKKAGFNPVPLPATEISTALQTGLVTAVPAPPQAAVLFQWYNQARNMTALNYGILVGGFVMTKDTWDKLPPEIRPALQESARKTARRLALLTREGAPKDIEAMVKRGLTVVTPDAAALQQWRTMIEAQYPLLRGKFIPAEAFDAALKARDACRASAKAAGR
jgi:TRAP-type C4-dicarboxylate transport system substrate-binding protein